jgi:hypothetical protein
MTRSFVGYVLSLVIGAAGGAVAMHWQDSRVAAQEAPASKAAAAPVDAAADIAHLKEVIPAQSHSMIDVGWHMANLWFAAKEQHWALAAFEVSEVRNRIRWTIRINPTAKGPDGNPVDLKGIFDGIDTSALPALKKAVDEKNRAAFESAYRGMIESCYSCHKAVGKPYLRTMVPTTPPQSIINYDPKARWPS